MMQRKQILIALFASLLVGLLAVVLATRWLATSGRVALVRVVQASRPLATGTTIATADLKMAEVDPKQVPRDAVSGVTAALGRITQVPLQAGAIVTEAALQPPPNMHDLAQVIAPGMRAFSIKVNEESQVSGFVLPGNYVDVVLNTKDNSGQPASVTVLQHLLVLAVAQDRQAPAEGKPKLVNAVTLQVTPEQAQTLDLARAVGSLTLVLRNQSDAELEVLGTAGRHGLFQPERAASAVAHAAHHGARRHPVERSTPVQIIRGLAP